MRRLSAIFLLLAVGLATSCKSTPPQVAGKWYGTSQLTATFTTAVSSKPRNENVPADFVLVLTQNGQTVQGDASVTAAKNPPIHIPIKAGVICPDGRLSLEGDANFTLARAHLSFDGKAEGRKITGTVNVALNNVSGSGENKGPLTLIPAN
jgi:hypothetical protein